MKALSVTVHKLWPGKCFWKVGQISRPMSLGQKVYDVKGLVTWNTHKKVMINRNVKYDSHVSHG